MPEGPPIAAALLPSLVTVLLAHLLMVGVFAYLAWRDAGASHMRLWAVSWAFGTLRYALALTGVATGLRAQLDGLAYLAIVAAGLLLMAGTYRFLRREMPRAWAVCAAGITAWIGLSWALAALGRPLPFVAETLPIFLFLAAVDGATGVAILRSPSLGPLRHLPGWALVLWAVHRLDYPFLREVGWFAPWGFSIAALFGVLVALGMILLYFERAWGDLRRSEARYRSIFENAFEGMFQATAEGRFLAANPALVRMLGYQREDELCARSLVEHVLVPDGTSPAGRLARLAGAAGPEGVEVELVRRDGGRLTALLQLRGLAGAEPGLVRAWEGSVRDVTHARRLQARLLQAQKLEALGRLAGGLAHDFNNVLTAILAGSDLAEGALRAGRSPDVEVRTIREAGERAAELTRKLLAFARRQPGAPPRPTDLNEAVTAGLTIVRPLLEPATRLEVRLAASPPVVAAEPGQVEQIVLNLALNARDAMPGGGTIEVATGLAPAVPGAPARACLTVRDEGQGFDEATRARLFEPFFTTKPPGKGTGLGLSTVYGTVSLLGGTVEVESAPGQGAVFRVLLPLVEGPPGEQLAPEAGAEPR